MSNQSPLQIIKPDSSATSEPVIQITDFNVWINDQHILNDISKSISENITVDISRMVISPDNVIITGTTDTFEAVDEIKNKLLFDLSKKKTN